MIINFSKAAEGEFYGVETSFSLDDSLLHGRNGRFITDAEVKGWYVLSEGNLTVKCKVAVTAEFDCDRCAEPSVIELNTEVAETFYKSAAEGSAGPLYENEQVELKPYIDERVILAVPSRILCGDECKGLCPVCGVNLNRGKCNCDTKIPQEANPFAALLDMNITSGGKKNGGSKA